QAAVAGHEGAELVAATHEPLFWLITSYRAGELMPVPAEAKVR
ncbi:MAG: hypothetical protein JWL99_6079, partial [Streptomyces oryziradicis]|nr:hypothetical protein [Actinacidiphila oryziradicis]